jgi:glutamine amidotransferase
MAQVVIIDSGGANIASLQFAIKRLNISAILSKDADTIRAADRVLLPGVGAAKDAMTRLAETNLIDVIRDLQQPVLGICLGMQLLCDASEEEDTDCLGVLPGITRRLPATTLEPVPNMGWCATHTTNDHSLVASIENGSFFYYLHSYALPVSDHTLATAKHSEPFSAIVAKDNFIGTQFHPERSAAAGAQLLRNFLAAAS